MHCGTTVDRFFRENSTWVGKATHWAKFSATAHHGVVHKGHRANAMNLLSAYLPNEASAGVTESPYVEGGALYALGLIHANRGAAAKPPATASNAGEAASAEVGPEDEDDDAGTTDVIEYLSNCLRNTQNEVIQHGACLGLGLAAMATGNDNVYALLRETLLQESAVAGEAAGLAIGLVLLGRGSDWVSEITGEAGIREMLAYAHDTQHEKTIRGIALGLAFVVYGMEEQAEGLIKQLANDADPILRYGGMYAVGMAYVGSANNYAIRRLLHVAVSDVNNDVRRAAVTNLGFVLYRHPQRVPKLVKLLTESFNSHVRYGACMALAVACAGTGQRDVISMLTALADDAVDIVKQGALLALSLVCQQQSDARVPEVKQVRERVEKTVTDKLKTTMVKMGAVLAHGILDAGGRNTVVSMGSKAGFTRMPAVVGMAVWLQHWYWFPFLHFLLLSLQPTALIGLDASLAMPKTSFAMCHCRPSWFAYPKMLEEHKETQKQRVATVQLSTTSKAKRKARGKAASATAAGESSAKVEPPTAPPVPTEDDVEMAGATGGAAAPVPEAAPSQPSERAEASKEEKDAAKTTAAEPTSFALDNPSRLTVVQQKFVTFPGGAASGSTDEATAGAPVVSSASKWIPAVPVTGSAHGGIVMLRDVRPDEPGEVQTVRAPRPGEDSEEGPEPDPPAPFEWTPPSE